MKFSDGDGTSGGMDMWPQTVETRLSEIRSDVRTLLYWTIGGFGGIFAALVTAYIRLDSKIDARFDTLSAKLDQMSTIVSNLPHH